MVQQQTYMHAQAQPRRRDIFFHIIKTLKLVAALITDRRIALWRKLLFAASLGILLALLFFPDVFNEAFLSLVLPVIGTIAGVPVDAGIDWLAFALVGVNLLKLFPEGIVAQHYQGIFR